MSVKLAFVASKHIEERDKLIFKRIGPYPFNRLMVGMLKASQVVFKGSDKIMYDPIPFKTDYGRVIKAGAQMEMTDALIKETNDQLLESKKVLENLHNDIVSLTDQIQPKLLEQVKRIRESRMTVVREIGEMLTMLRDIRKFFIESEYSVEMERLTRFVEVCKEIERMKANGTLDAVCDVILKLSLEGGKKT